MQRLRAHALISVIQARIRGMQVRAWFRASLAAAANAGKVASKSYFRRLVAINAVKRSASFEASCMPADALDLQVYAFDNCLRSAFSTLARSLACSTFSSPSGLRIGASTRHTCWRRQMGMRQAHQCTLRPEHTLTLCTRVPMGAHSCSRFEGSHCCRHKRRLRLQRWMRSGRRAAAAAGHL